MARRKATVTRKRRSTRSRSPKRVVRRRARVKRRSADPRKGPVKRPKVNKSIIKPSTAAAHHAVRKNPFHSATSQPKIPDGGLSSSLSRRLTYTTEIQNHTEDAGNLSNVMHVILSPSTGIPVVVFNTQDGKTKRSGSSYYPQVIGTPNQSVGLQPNNDRSGGPLWPPISLDSYTLVNNGSYAKWRTVSEGLQLNLINSDEENEGWFQACRFNWVPNIAELSLTPIDGTTTSTAVDQTLGLAPNEAFFTNTLESMSMNEQPGYVTGMLKELSKKQFMLHPQHPNHDPIDIYNSVNLIEDTDFDLNTATGMGDLRYNSNKAKQLVDQMVDKNMDWLYIRVYCRQNTGSSNGTRLLVDLIQNIEMAFAPKSDFAAFQTINVSDKNTKKVTDDINNNRDAANPRGKS